MERVRTSVAIFEEMDPQSRGFGRTACTTTHPLPPDIGETDVGLGERYLDRVFRQEDPFVKLDKVNFLFAGHRGWTGPRLFGQRHKCVPPPGQTKGAPESRTVGYSGVTRE